jgi:hypothetical protein
MTSAGRSFAHLSHAFLPNASQGERIFSASGTESASAAFMTSDGTQLGNCSRLDWCAPLRVCSSHTLASCSFRNREASLINAGQRRRCTYVILPSTSLQTRMSGLAQIAFTARKISFPFGWPHQLPPMAPPAIASARFGRGPRAAWRTIPWRSTNASTSFWFITLFAIASLFWILSARLIVNRVIRG